MVPLVNYNSLNTNLFDLTSSAFSNFGLSKFSIEAGTNDKSLSDLNVFVSEENCDFEVVRSHVQQMPLIESIRRNGIRFSIRFSNDAILARAGQLMLPFDANKYLFSVYDDSRKSVLVDFGDPNANKPLHVGHLRNLIIGNSIASLFRTAGFRVDTQSIVCDIGRNVAEAMAGEMLFPNGNCAHGKRDVQIGDSYSKYVQSVPLTLVGSSGDGPIQRELCEASDLANELLVRWFNADNEIIQFWRRLITDVMEGQMLTLSSLGIRYDRYLFESTAIPAFKALVEKGLSIGCFKRMNDGSVIYETDDEGYPVIPLVRSDGFPTEHLRAIVLWSFPHAGYDVCIHVMGDEWVTSTIHREVIVKKLSDAAIFNNYIKIPHAMVQVNGLTMKSSVGGTILIDDVIANERTILDLVDIERRIPVSRNATIMFLVCLFLSKPNTKTIDFSQSLLDDDENVPAVVCRAWSKSFRLENNINVLDRPIGASARLAILQLDNMRRLQYTSIVKHDPMIIVKFLYQISKWFLRQEGDCLLNQIMNRIFTVALRMLWTVN